MKTHYEKYKTTIKKVARRHRLLKDKWITDYLMTNSCYICGESELICLQFYPDDRKIRALSKKSDDKKDGVIHKGIAKRYFSKSFTIADDVKIEDAELKDGLLKIYLMKIVPEGKKPKKITVK